MRCVNVVGCEDVRAGRCNGNQIKLKYPCERFKGVEADTCDGCVYKGGEVYSECEHCCRNEKLVDNYKFAGGE